MTVEWAKYNIQANAVCPTVIMTPLGEMVGRPEGRRSDALQDAASASDLITSQAIFADGGYTAV